MHYKSYNSKQLSLILKSLDKARNTTRVLVHTFHVYFKSFTNRIGGMMVSVLVSSGVDRMLESRSGQTIDYKICMCSPSDNNATLKSKNKDLNQEKNVSEWSDMSTSQIFVEWASTILSSRKRVEI
jgi:hypothetical protein